jgi:hypothetical protein
MGVTEVAVTGSYVYVAMSRIGGSGWGAIVRLKKPAPLPENGSAHFKDRLDLYTRLLETAEVLSETSGGKCWLCSSADGQRVFYKIRQTDTDLGPKLMLVEDDGVPREISLSDR